MAIARPERLDQILIRLGFATEEQVAQALRKQQGLGGRLGTHLVYAGHVTEEQLGRALAVQFGVPAYDPARQRPSAELLARLPEGFARRHLVLPLSFDEESGTLGLAAVDPRDTTAIGETRSVLHSRRVSLWVIPEVTLEKVLAGAGLDGDGLHGPRRLIELPELFAGADESAPAAPRASAAAAAPAAPSVLLVTGRSFLASFLVPLFEREGRALVVAPDPAQAAAALARGDIGHVLVAEDMAAAWREQAPAAAGGAVRPPVTRLGPVGETLLGTAAPYAALRRSLLGALQLLAERAGEGQPQPPAYDLLRRDARTLGEALGLDLLAVDALEAAALMLAPAPPPAANVEALLADDGTGLDWSRTLGTAAAVEFPWPLGAALAAMRQLLGGRVNLDEFGRNDPEVAQAAQVLALVWHHHQRSAALAGGGEAHTANRNASLRAQGGRLARPEIVERYVQALSRAEDDLIAAAGQQLLLVGGEDRSLRQLAARLGHLGYRIVAVRGLDEAAEICARQAPTAVLVHEASFPHEVLRVRERLAAGARLPVFAVTGDAEPARLLTLFDAGFADVYALPRDLDLVPARLRQALRAPPAGANAGAPAAPARPGAFQATFAAFAFTDLMQTLSQSFKSVRIDLERSGGERAVMFLDRGQLVHAACGALRGAEAVYRVIAWEDDGSFAVQPESRFPAPNLGLPLESILMEGCRLLDESRIRP
ncbi:DUF4388 domain-containing protein [bacterium]|nr:DUF4388 domain-containing protein [bacterium]